MGVFSLEMDDWAILNELVLDGEPFRRMPGEFSETVAGSSNLRFPLVVGVD